MTFPERGAVLERMVKALHGAREELLDVSVENTGTTRKDAKFDVDGATAVLQFYASLAGSLGDRRALVDGDGFALGRSARFWGQHVRVPLQGAAVFINAYNFPVWGYAEKLGPAILAGMPVIIKPATSTAFTTEASFVKLVEQAEIPDGVVSLVCGSPGDLLDRLGSQDVVAFTGSARTALAIRGNPRLLAAGTRVNVEADSLNAAVLGPDVEPGTETWNLFVKDVLREIVQKTGQKCTAIRRVFVPEDKADLVQDALAERLAETVTGDPADDTVTMGPLCTAAQLEDALAGLRDLQTEADLVHGAASRISGVGAVPGKGYFLGPVLLRARDSGRRVHEREVFGPVATILPYSGDASEVAGLVARAEGTLVVSLYSDDDAFAAAYLENGGAYTGRLYLGSEKMAAQAYGSGAANPLCLHGGPGRAGGGEELGGVRALHLYTQRLALQGGKRMVLNLSGAADAGGE
jgi:oxepin-CoA hydrolase/3-oxo-5,6-dehydrosuberyl-CoA semialdehyde dehydrogenase